MRPRARGVLFFYNCSRKRLQRQESDAFWLSKKERENFIKGRNALLFKTILGLFLDSPSAIETAIEYCTLNILNS